MQKIRHNYKQGEKEMTTQHRLKPKNSCTAFEQLWLMYFNNTLYAKGLITEDQRNKMCVKIKNRSASADK